MSKEKELLVEKVKKERAETKKWKAEAEKQKEMREAVELIFHGLIARIARTYGTNPKDGVHVLQVARVKDFRELAERYAVSKRDDKLTNTTIYEVHEVPKEKE